jgi:hypothetical protein
MGKSMIGRGTSLSLGSLPARRDPVNEQRETKVSLRNLLSFFAAVLYCAVAPAALDQFDQQHKAWTALLGKHVVLIDGGKASQLRYPDMATDRAALRSYLETLSRVDEAEFRKWSKDDQLAFLINAYNANMIELILTRYPRIDSVWDFGKLVSNPFKNRFIRLFGRDVSLDTIEHETIRAKGAYDEPRIHMAVNCASVGCPMLREEAYVGGRLDKQLEEQVVRFLSDRSRNRYNASGNTLEVSEIFRWYREDFESGYKGIRSREQFFAKYAAQLADGAGSEAVRNQKAAIRTMDYDWRLNDARK